MRKPHGCTRQYHRAAVHSHGVVHARAFPKALAARLNPTACSRQGPLPSRKEIIISTAVVLVRRFYVVKSLRDHDHAVCSHCPATTQHQHKLVRQAAPGAHRTAHAQQTTLALAHLQIIACAAMFLSCKLHNCPVMLGDCVVIVMYAALRILKEPVFSSELSIAFGELRQAQAERGLSDAFTRALWEVPPCRRSLVRVTRGRALAAWRAGSDTSDACTPSRGRSGCKTAPNTPRAPLQKLKGRMVPMARRAELALLAGVGFQHLHELGWEWQVLATMRQRYKLWNAPNWDPNAQELESADTAGVSAAGSQQPAATAASAAAGASAGGGGKAPAVAKSGQDLAKDFILDACAARALPRAIRSCPCVRGGQTAGTGSRVIAPCMILKLSVLRPARSTGQRRQTGRNTRTDSSCGALAQGAHEQRALPAHAHDDRHRGGALGVPGARHRVAHAAPRRRRRPEGSGVGALPPRGRAQCVRRAGACGDGGRGGCAPRSACVTGSQAF